MCRYPPLRWSRANTAVDAVAGCALFLAIAAESRLARGGVGPLWMRVPLAPRLAMALGLSFATTLPQGLPLARTVVPLEGWTPDGPLYTGTRTLTEKVIRWHTGEVERYVYPDDPYEIDSKPLPAP